MMLPEMNYRSVNGVSNSGSAGDRISLSRIVASLSKFASGQAAVTAQQRLESQFDYTILLSYCTYSLSSLSTHNLSVICFSVQTQR